MRDIIEGWAGWILRRNSILAKYRLQRCKKCEHRKKGIIDRCGKCGCVIQAKVRCFDCMCPDVKW